MDLKQLPKRVTDLLKLNPREKQLQFHGSSEGSAGRHGKEGSLHGRAEDSDETKNNLLFYFQSVDRVVNSMIRSDGAPLVLAGVAPAAAILRY